MVFFLGLCAAGIVSLLLLLVADARGDGSLARAGRSKGSGDSSEEEQEAV